MLILCATPIGNLSDITERVLTALKEADLIAAEDTRHTRQLLSHFDIQNKLTSYHEHNKYEKAEELLAVLHEGKSVALVTDAGTPAISDPGEVLVRRCLEEGIPVTSLPGACALITALTLSGESTRRFVFEGFLPREKKERAEVLAALAGEQRTIVLYEAPHRLSKTLKELHAAMGNRNLTLCRELTKLHEEAVPTTIEDAMASLEETPARGEYVLVIRGADPAVEKEKEAEKWLALPVKDHVDGYVAQGLAKQEAMKRAAKDRGIPKREVFTLYHEEA